VTKSLEDIGPLESFQYRSVPGRSKVKATATFLAARDAASEAVRALHNTNMEVLGNTKLFVNHVVSIKYNVLDSVACALQEEFNALATDILRSHAHLKIYPKEDPKKPLTTIRLSWENLKNTSGAKLRLEKLLAGTVVMKENAPLWDNYFNTPAALVELQELRAIYKLGIEIKVKNAQLVMYGGSLEARQEVQRVLVEKVEALSKSEHRIYLTSTILRQARDGGMQRLKDRFGDAVGLFISFGSSARMIQINGTKEDLRESYALLCECDIPQSHAADVGREDACSICWTRAVDPMRTSCNHIYCKECFANQASSVSEALVPLRCLGMRGSCKQVFNIEQLKDMLSSTQFESLLKTSFHFHVRSRTEDFQYCPTPDCPQVYRPTDSGEVIICSSCLTPICTKCKVLSHDGMTCEGWEEMDAEDNRLLRQYKDDYDVRNCPKCKAGIEKFGGCNHMKCL
jgi:IBR domain, a half RING-finger domain/Zinc finger, C3HC4 type (RING finger)